MFKRFGTVYKINKIFNRFSSSKDPTQQMAMVMNEKVAIMK